LFALLTFWPRNYPVLRPGELRKYLTYETENTRLMLHDTIGTMITRGGRVLETKARYLKIALVLLLLAAITFGAGIIYSSSTAAAGRAHHGKEGPVAPAPATPSRSSPAPSTSAGGRVGHHIHRARRQAG
jgi:hypothetical protein